MQTLIATVLLITLAMLGLSLGLMFGRQPIKGSCGDLSCTGTCGGCERRKEDKP